MLEGSTAVSLLSSDEVQRTEKKMRNDKENIIVEKTFNLALEIIKLSESLNNNKQYILAKQLFKSGTSIGANVREAQNAESRSDFIHKMKIAAKESEETEFWLQILERLGYTVKVILNDCNEIQLILSKIISTSKKIRP